MAHTQRIKFSLLKGKKHNDLSHIDCWEQLPSCVILPDPFQEERLKSESGSVLTLNSMDDCDSD